MKERLILAVTLMVVFVPFVYCQNILNTSYTSVELGTKSQYFAITDMIQEGEYTIIYLKLGAKHPPLPWNVSSKTVYITTHDGDKIPWCGLRGSNGAFIARNSDLGNMRLNVKDDDPTVFTLETESGIALTFHEFTSFRRENKNEFSMIFHTGTKKSISLMIEGIGSAKLK
jgi:hypothetical protein